jgi:hypothetical protein
VASLSQTGQVVGRFENFQCTMVGAGCWLLERAMRKNKENVYRKMNDCFFASSWNEKDRKGNGTGHFRGEGSKRYHLI